MEFINLKAAYKAYEDEFIAAFKSQCEDAAFIGGSAVSELEAELANYTNTPCISCSDGTNALVLALKAANIGAGDEVISSPFTFVATAEAIALCGAKVVFSDIGEDFCLDIEQLDAKITPKTKAIIGVSLFGSVDYLDKLSKFAKERNILLIEDAAQSFGARTLSALPSCGVADISTTSFFPSKPLGCFGDGSAIFCKDAEIFNRAKLLANHGSSERYKHEIIGTNSRLDAIQAAILRVKLKHLDDELAIRRQIAARYSQELCSDFVLPRAGANSAWAQYCVMLNNRDEFCRELKKQNIPTAIYYPIPLHLQPAFKHLGYRAGDFGVAEFCANHICALPFSPYLAPNEQEKIIKAANDAIKKLGGALCLPNKRALVFGAGKMGKNHINELAKSGYKISAIDPAKVELDAFSAQKVKLINESDLANERDFELIIIASPSSQHAQSANVLKHPKIVAKTIIEKPLANSLNECESFDNAAFVGFNERFNAAFMQLENLVKNHTLKSAKFIRQSAKPERIKDADVAQDLGSHDLDLAQFLGFDLAELRLIERSQDYFCAQSKKLQIIASYRASEPLRGVLIELENGEQIAADLKNWRIYSQANPSGEYEFMGAKFGSFSQLAGFSNLAAMYEAKNQNRLATKADGMKIIAALERLK